MREAKSKVHHRYLLPDHLLQPFPTPPTPNLQKRKPKQKQAKNPWVVEKSEGPSALQPTKAYNVSFLYTLAWSH